MRLEFGGRLDRWLDPPDDEYCECGEPLDYVGCTDQNCKHYVPSEDEEEEQDTEEETEQEPEK